MLFTEGRREGVFKMCLNFSSILLAAMLASEFFVKFSMVLRTSLGMALILLITLGIIACPPKKQVRE